MSLIDRVKNILKEAPDRTPDSPSGLDFEGQSKKFVKNERDKKKTMRKLEPKGSKQGELNLGNTNTTNTPLSTKRTLKGRPLGSKTKSKGETYKQLTTGGERQKQRKIIKKEFKKQQPISDLKKAKKYAAGEYPKIGGGGLKPDIKKPIKGTTPVKTNVSKVNVDKIFSGAGNVKKGGNVPDKNISSKSKGITPVKTNISKVNVDKIFDKPKNPITKTIGVKQSDVSKTQKKFTQKINKANKNRKEFEYAKSKEIKKFRGTVTQGADKGRGYTIERNPSPKGSRKGIPINKPKDIPIEKSNRAIGDLFKRYGRGEPKATQFVIDMGKDDRKARGLGKRAERIKDASGGKKTGSLRKGNLSFPGDRTGAYSRTKSQIDFNKALKKARGNTEGDIPAEAPKSVKDYAKGVRDKRIKKLKLPDTSFDSKTKAKTKFDDIFKGVKKQKIKSGGQTQFDISKTPVGKIKLPSPKVSPEAKKKSYDKFAKQISKYSKKVSASGSAIQDLKDVDKATMRTVPIKKGAVPDNTTRYDVGMASRKITKKYAPGTTGKVQMRGGATNIPTGPKTPPKKYNIPPDDRPGKLVQGRDFASKKSYDAKLEKQIKILRGKASNLRKKQIQVHKTKPIRGDGRDIERSKSVRKLGARMRERTKAADALEKSLKRQGTTGPTSMLPVVSGKGADAKMPGMGDKTYKQFYKDANVGKQYKPPKVKSTPKPPPIDPNIEDTVKKTYKSGSWGPKRTTNFGGSLRDTAKFQRRVDRLKRGFGGNKGKRAFAGKVGRFLKAGAKNNPVLATLAVAGAGIYGYNKIKNAITRKGPTAMSKSTFAGSLKYGKGYGKHAGKSVEVTNNRNNKDMNKLAKGITTKNYNTPKMQKTIDSRIRSGEYNMVNRKGQILKYPSKTK